MSKLKLEDLKVKSFITSNESSVAGKTDEFKGGAVIALTVGNCLPTQQFWCTRDTKVYSCIECPPPCTEGFSGCNSDFNCFPEI